MTRTLCFILAMALSASNALAVLQAYFENVEINSELALAQNYTTQDLYINTTAGDTWGTAQILAALTSGSIYQDPNGSFFAPNPLLFDTYPELEYDSYLDGNGQQPMIAGQAVNLGGDVQEFSEDHIDITWLGAGQNNIGTFSIGRFTLSNDAYGTWAIYVTSTSGYRTYQGSIVAGEFDLRETGGGEPIVGDLDSDGFVGLGDLDIVLGDWNKTIFTGDPVDIGDITSDGFVGLDDLDIILANWKPVRLPGRHLRRRHHWRRLRRSRRPRHRPGQLELSDPDRRLAGRPDRRHVRRPRRPRSRPRQLEPGNTPHARKARPRARFRFCRSLHDYAGNRPPPTLSCT